ncbi:MAG: NosD domain-containing protein [Candidatus Bathyarchaeia archaeon]
MLINSGDTNSVKHRKILIATVLIAIIIVSFFVASNLLSPAKQTEGPSKPFYVGIETGWSATVAQCEAIIDQVKNYTNMYIIASPQVIKNETELNQVCDYAYTAGMYFMPEFYQQFFLNQNGYTPYEWFNAAQERYGDHLLGVYYYDEPAGSQLDTTQIIENQTIITPTSPAKSYLDYTNYFFWLWTHGSGGGLTATSSFFKSRNSSLFTSDYGLYWFDYELGYNTVLAQFGWNDSRPMQISLVRGAAAAQNQTWGAIVTWTYNGTTNGGIYLEPPDQMYSDIVLAYDSGASYVAIYDSTQNYLNTTLNPQYRTKLQEFWSYMHQNPNNYGSLKADAAVVLPQDYGIGFRNIDDSIWQNHTATHWSRQLYTDITNLVAKYKGRLDIVYSDPQFRSLIQSEYSKSLYWPQNFENGANYQIVDLNDSLGYNTIQDAVSSFATYEGHLLLVKSGTYQENVAVNKPLTFTSQNNQTTIIDGADNGTVLSIDADNVAVTGFTIKNTGSPSAAIGTGILLENAQNCTVNNNIVTDNYVGVLLVNSTYNVFRSNEINGNTNNLILQNSEPNSIDSSNIVGGKPYATG